MLNPSSGKRHHHALLCALASVMGASSTLAQDLSKSTGPQLFRQFCASCHGPNGDGDGPVAPFFRLIPPDLTLIARRAGGAFPAGRMQRIVDGREVLPAHGSREMPVWGMQFSLVTGEQAAADAAIARLVEHLRSIQKPLALKP
jgi:mono/diheme cytochrome c family protein